jgi:hypothetical protein
MAGNKKEGTNMRISIEAVLWLSLLLAHHQKQLKLNPPSHEPPPPICCWK